MMILLCDYILELIICIYINYVIMYDYNDYINRFIEYKSIFR